MTSAPPGFRACARSIGACVLAATLHACLAVSILAQQDDGNTLPVHRVPPGATAPRLQFVALARERGTKQQKDWSDMQATLWDIQPERAKEPAVRRCVLGRSMWKAAPLLSSPTLLRWQVPDSQATAPGYSVRLLRVDYPSFHVTELLRTKQAQALGGSGNTIFLTTDHGQAALDVDSGALRELQPSIRVLAKHGDDWLIVVEGQVARFDAASAKPKRRYPAIKLPAEAAEDGWVHWDGGRFAVCAARFFDEQGEEVLFLKFQEPAIVYHELFVWDLQEGTESTLRVRLQARGGSGVAVIPMTMQIELTGGLFRYTERRDATGEHENLYDFDWQRDAEWVTIDILTGKELLRVPYHERLLPKTEVPAAEAVPAYLQELFEASPIRAWGSVQDLAHAFLTHSAVELNLPTTGVCKLDAVCRTTNGEQLLVLHDGIFYLCSLKTKELERFAAPEALARADVELYAVSPR